MVLKTLVGGTSWSGKGFIHWTTQRPCSGSLLWAERTSNSSSGLGHAMHSTGNGSVPFSWGGKRSVVSHSGVSTRVKMQSLYEFAEPA